jgi:hypothetical protein
MRFGLLLLASLLWAGCSGTSTGTCSDSAACPSGQSCINGGHCAVSCFPDGGGDCPSGTACQFTSGFCRGTACSAISVDVCLKPDGTP